MIRLIFYPSESRLKQRQYQIETLQFKNHENLLEGYYNGTVKQATDSDSPVPNAQIAARSPFLFAVECGNLKWAEYACKLLAQALTDWGMGGFQVAEYH